MGVEQKWPVHGPRADDRFWRMPERPPVASRSSGRCVAAKPIDADSEDGAWPDALGSRTDAVRLRASTTSTAGPRWT